MLHLTGAGMKAVQEVGNCLQEHCGHCKWLSYQTPILQGASAFWDKSWLEVVISTLSDQRYRMCNFYQDYRQVNSPKHDEPTVVDQIGAVYMFRQQAFKLIPYWPSTMRESCTLSSFVGEQQNDELVDSYLMNFERFIYMEWSIQKIPNQQYHVIMWRHRRTF
jgi:hypothetical protein